MNKKILVTAIGAAMTAGYGLVAQADVKVYGAAQVEIARVTNDEPAGGSAVAFNGNSVPADSERTMMVDNKRGRVGVAVSEDLGAGLQGIAKFEWNLDTTDNVDGPASTPFAPRDSWVGMKGGFGTLRLGRSGSPYKQSGTALDPFVTTTLEARNNFGMSGNRTGGVLNAHNSFQSDGVFYTTPNLGGLYVDVYYGVDQTSATNDDVSVVAGFKTGALNLFAGYNQDNTPTAAKPTATKIGGQFKFGPNTLSAQYEQTDLDTGPAGEIDWLFLSYQLKMGNTTLVAQGGQAESDDSSVDGQYLALGAVYNFSKTFRVFTGYRQTEEEGAPVTRDDNVITVGMRKDF